MPVSNELFTQSIATGCVYEIADHSLNFRYGAPD
jgi:hypothetical protein